MTFLEIQRGEMGTTAEMEKEKILQQDKAFSGNGVGFMYTAASRDFRAILDAFLQCVCHVI